MIMQGRGTSAYVIDKPIKTAGEKDFKTKDPNSLKELKTELIQGQEENREELVNALLQ